MAPVVRAIVVQVATVAVTAVATAFVQWALYTIEVRQDIHDLQRDVSALDCRMAILSREITLPMGCNAAIVTQQGRPAQP